MKQDLLIYGKQYHTWRNGNYTGVAIYTDDPNIGDAFLQKRIEDKEEINQVVIPDEWEFAL